MNIGILAGLLLMAGPSGLFLVISIRKERRQKNRRLPHNMEYVYGEVVDIVPDKSGLSRIVIRERNGNLVYSLSEISVPKLETLYMGKGFVQIPVKGSRI